MDRVIPLLALALIASGVVGLGAVGAVFQSPPPSNAPNQSFAPFGMMGRSGMMRGYGYAPPVSATPVPATRPIDREIKITARNLQFDPAQVTVKQGETIKFTLVNEDAAAHNLISQDGKIGYTFLPPNATQSVVWVAAAKGNYTAVCTFHAGMQIRISVE